MVGVGGGCGVGGVGGAGDVGVVGIVNVGVAGVVVASGVVGVISVFTPMPSVCIYPPLHTFPSNVGTGGGAGGQARPRKEVSRRLYIIIFD